MRISSRLRNSLVLALGALGIPATAQERALVEDTADAVVVEDLLAHYERVERELRAARLDGLAPEARERRARAIEALRAYRERAEFGRSADFPHERKPLFVDEGGRHCAVAWLMHRDGRDDLVERVRGSANHAFVAELAQDTEFRCWLAESGLSLEDAVRIQGPGQRLPVGPVDRRPRESAGGVAPAEPSSPSTPASPAASAAPGSSSPGPRGPATPAGSPAGPASATSPAPSSDVGPEAWWTWWLLHKLDYLRPNLLRNWVATITGWAEEGASSSAALDGVRRELRPALLEALRTGDAALRGAAAIALGRTGGEEAVPVLRELFDDASLDVRERALLALGATGTDSAAELLLEVARFGALDEGRGAAISGNARALAVLALAVGRRGGMDARVDDALAHLAMGLAPDEEPDLHAGLLLYQTLNPSPTLEGWVMRRAADAGAPFDVRCRALETLRTQSGDASLALLTRELSGRSIERRRSAALALGELEHELALPALLTAAELEREPLARGFTLISIGRKGGDAARELLIEELREGRKDTRGWCALALGILARGGGDERACEALRDALGEVKDRSLLGAYYLALGIARDAKSEELLLEALREGSMAETRSAAAMALAMLGSEGAKVALRERLASDPCPFTRAEIAQALAYLGDAADSERLVAALAELRDPSLRGSTGLALGMHGTRSSVEGLMALAADDQTPDAVRASCFDALQVVLGTSPSLTVGELTRQSNFAVFPNLLARLREVLL